jgi:hypothetical protein
MRTTSRSLLLLACTATKLPYPGLLPAIHRYDGPSFRTLRKWQATYPAHARQIDILILSARLGLITAATLTEDYNQRMTPARASSLQPSFSGTFQRFIAEHGPYRATLIHLGRDYLPALVPNIDPSLSTAHRVEQLRGWFNRLAGDHPGLLTVTEGGIGTRLGQLKHWLYDLTSNPDR